MLLGFAVVVSGLVIAGLSAVLWVLDVAAKAPNIEDLKPVDPGASSKILAADGSTLTYIRSEVNRTPVGWDQIPVVLRNATISIEDERYYEHSGVDWIGIVRAVIRDIQAGGAREGASTITQQLVRNLYIEDPTDDLTRKIVEAKLAEELEERRSKRWILEQYLNTASYGTVNGSTAVGVQAAAEMFFDKPAKELSLREAALLAGLPQAPSEYNPLNAESKQAALDRRNEVLEAMARLGYISSASARSAEASGLGTDPGDKYTRRREPFFVGYVEDALINKYGSETVREGGLVVHTTIDPKLQELANAAIADSQASLHLSYGDTIPSSAMVATTVNNGHIVAMASSANPDAPEFNLAAQGRRQPGSAFKPFVLATAIKQGADPDATFYDGTPTSLDVGGPEPWTPQNSSEGEGGVISLRTAMVDSVNVVYAKLGLDVGNENLTETAQDMGITSPLFSYPAEAIGGLNTGVTPLEMSNAYATFANGGLHYKPTAIDRVEFPNGEVDQLDEDKPERAFSDGVAYAMVDVMKGVISSGTATQAGYGCPAAGKTGTTDDHADAWFVGFTPKMSTAVWTGFPGATLSLAGYNQGFGGTLSAPIWRSFMYPASNGYCDDFPAATEPVSYLPFFGEHAASSGSSSDETTTTATTDTTTTDTATTDTTGGYDSGAYAPGIQGPPETAPPDLPIQPGQ